MLRFTPLLVNDPLLGQEAGRLLIPADWTRRTNRRTVMRLCFSFFMASVAVLAGTDSGQAGETICWLDQKRQEYLMDTQGQTYIRFAVWFAKKVKNLDVSIQVYDPEGKRLKLEVEKLDGDRVFYFFRDPPTPGNMKIVISCDPATGPKHDVYLVLFSWLPIRENSKREEDHANAKRSRTELAGHPIRRMDTGRLDGKRYEYLLDTAGRMCIRFAIWFSKGAGDIDASIQVYDPQGKRLKLETEKLTGDRVLCFRLERAAPGKMKIVVCGNPAAERQLGQHFVLFSSNPLTLDPEWLKKCEAEERHKTEQAIAAIKKLGGRVYIDDRDPGKPVRIRLDGIRLSGKDLNPLADIPQLRILDLSSTELKDEDLRSVGKLTQVEVLKLANNTGLNKQCLEHLRGMTNLRTLEIYATRLGYPREIQKVLPQVREVRGP